MGKDITHLVWIDLETTGTDATLDPILEVGMVITDTDLNERSRHQYVVRPELDYESRLGDFVRQMHTTNGLLHDVETEAQNPALVESLMIADLSAYGKKHDFALAGSGVAHFDRRFLDAQMPKFVRWVRYWSIDVGVLRRSLELFGRSDMLLRAPDKTHRALDDALLHLEEFRHIRSQLS